MNRETILLAICSMAITLCPLALAGWIRAYRLRRMWEEPPTHQIIYSPGQRKCPACADDIHNYETYRTTKYFPGTGTVRRKCVQCGYVWYSSKAVPDDR
jgi:hypothetical protein